MPRISYKPEISLGNLISGVALVVTLWALASGISSRLTALEVKMDAVWAAYVKGGH